MMSGENKGFQDPKEEMESIALRDGDAEISPLLSSPPPFVEIPTHEDDINGYDPLYSPPNPLGDPLQHRSQSKNPDPNSFLLEPPSYADAVFRSFDASSDVNGHDLSTSSSPSSSSSSDYLVISVTAPRKEPELSTSLVPGGSSYYSYLVSTRTNLPEYDGAEFNVRRRFRDVVTLSDRLSESYRGCLIPVRPDKSVVESQVMQQQEFVEQRRVALEKYLRKLAKHPVIRRSEELRLFLTENGSLQLVKTTDVASRMLDGTVKSPKQLLWTETTAGVVNTSEVFQPAKGGRDLLWIFKELKQSMSNDWGAAKPPVVEEDSEFMERKRKLQDLEVQLSNVSLQAEELVKAQQDIGETVGQLGLALLKLTKFETEEALCDSQRTRATDMKNIAMAAVKASRLYLELNSQTVKHLDKLHDYLGTMLSVNNAFSDRSNALLTLQTLLSDLSSLNSRIEKLEIASSKIFGGDRSRLQKIEELKETVRVTENAKDCAISEYARIKENNKNELDRLDRERHDDFLSMLRGFVVNQAGYAEKIANVWETVAEETSRYAKNVG